MGTALTGRGAFNLLDVLESEHPVLAQDLGGSGLAAYLGSAHGAGQAVQVVVDGVPAGRALNPGWDLRQIPLEGIAKVAWYPGPQSAAWGGGATGGVLSITTRRSLAPTARSQIGLLLGSFDAQAFSGYLGRPLPWGGDALVAANFDFLEGFFSTAGDFTRNQSVVRAGWGIGDRHRIEIARRGDGISGTDARLDLTGTEDVDDSALHAFYTGGAGPVTARLHWSRAHHAVKEAFQLGSAPGILADGDMDDVRGTLEARLGGRALVWAGGAWSREDASSVAPAFFIGGVNALDPPEGEVVEAIVPRETVEIGGGAGFGTPTDRFGGNLAVRSFAFGDGRSELAWQVEGVARPGAGVTLRAFAGRSARPPDLAGQAVLANLEVEGTEVHPGRAADPDGLEVWTEWRGEAAWTSGGWHVAGRVWRATGDGAFVWLPPTAWTRFDPTLGTFPLGTAGFNTFDVLDVTATGLEGEAVIPLPFGVEGRIHLRKLDEKADHLAEPLPYVPELQALGQLRYARRFFPSRDLLVEARIAGRYQGDRTTLSGATLEAGLVGDALLQLTIIHFTIFVSLKNFTNQEVRTEEAVDLPGAEGFVGINWRFRS
jgi:outer membrane receptor protein involved in Fe transport